MMYRNIILLLILCLAAPSLSAQASVEFLSLSELRIIDTETSDARSFTPIEFLDLIKDEWTNKQYLNEYEGEVETRLYRKPSYLHKEALAQNHLGNSAFLDSSLILEEKNGHRFYVGMPISTLKRDYKLSFCRSVKFHSDEGKNLKVITIPEALNHEGRLVLSNTSGLTLIYNSQSGKVTKMYSRR